jgi:hypothetical protein
MLWAMTGGAFVRGACVIAAIAAVTVVPASGAKSGSASIGRANSSGAAHIYWSEPEAGKGPSGHGIDNIWRCNLNGTGVSRHFVTGLVVPGDVAVQDPYLYWLDSEASTIGRAQLDGTHVQRNLLQVGGTSESIAVRGAHIYWATGSFSGQPALVWQADLNGSHARKLFSVGKGFEIGGLAVNGEHIYWANTDKGTIGRASLNGTNVELSFLTGLASPIGLALGQKHLYWASFGTVYWASFGTGSIGRADLGGGHVNKQFITAAGDPRGIAVGAGHIYWANSSGGAIGRARVDGTHANPGFIPARVLFMGSDGADPGAVAVGP